MIYTPNILSFFHFMSRTETWPAKWISNYSAVGPEVKAILSIETSSDKVPAVETVVWWALCKYRSLLLCFCGCRANVPNCSRTLAESTQMKIFMASCFALCTCKLSRTIKRTLWEEIWSSTNFLIYKVFHLWMSVEHWWICQFLTATYLQRHWFLRYPG